LNRPPAWRLLFASTMVGLVAVGARGGSAIASLRLGRPDPTALLYVLVAAVIVGVTGAWAVASLLRRRQADPGHGGGRSPGMTLRRVFPGAVVAIALVGLLSISRMDLAVEPPPTGVERPHSGGREGVPLNFLDDRGSPVRAGEGAQGPTSPVADDRPMQVGVALLVLLVGGAALAWWWVGRRRRAATEALAAEIDAEAARSTVLRTIEAMLSDPDPKTAIIGAYARLLEGLAAWGVPRRSYEGPVEHLRRALARLPVRPGPIRRLVGLFEVARFSTHALTVDHRDDALEALRQVAADLGGGAVALPETARASVDGAPS